MPGLPLFLDFEKAFDTLEWPFICKTFEYFGFDPSLLNWLKVFYCNSESCILNNGWASHFFELNRGVRQGCPLSPYLFILSVEVLANAIRQKKDQPRSQGLSSYRPLDRAKRDPGWVWSRVSQNLGDDN